MGDLRELVEQLGGKDVRTYVQSGNIVFRSGLAPSKLEKSLEQSIRRALGLDVTVLVRTGKQLAEIVAGNPFLRAGADPSKLHVTLLAAAPDRACARQLSEGDFAPDELGVVGDSVYLHCPNGYGRSKLSNAFLERQLGVPATTRNWKTMTALAELAAGG
jgi:uncharacterized protein (DUF1697 family)